MGNGEWGMGNGEWGRSNKGVLSFLSAGYANTQSNHSFICRKLFD